MKLPQGQCNGTKLRIVPRTENDQEIQKNPSPQVIDPIKGTKQVNEDDKLPSKPVYVDPKKVDNNEAEDTMTDPGSDAVVIPLNPDLTVEQKMLCQQDLVPGPDAFAACVDVEITNCHNECTTTDGHEVCHKICDTTFLKSCITFGD